MFVCVSIGRSFGSTGDLRRHIRSHSGEKPYSCEMCGKSFTRSAVLRRHHTIHCKSTSGVSPSSDRKESDQATKSPQPHPITAVKAARALDQPFGFQLQQGPTSEQSSSSAVMQLQQTVPNHILATHSGKCPDSDTNSKNPHHALSIEVSFCPFSGEHGPVTSLVKLQTHGTLSALSTSNQSGSNSQTSSGLTRSSEHIFPA